MNDPKASKETTVAPSGEGGMRNLPSLLPLELQRHIFSFLNPTDAVALSCALPTSIVVRKLKPDRCLRSGHVNGEIQLPMVANLSKGIVHSMTFRAHWKKSFSALENREMLRSLVIVAIHRRSSGMEPSNATLFGARFLEQWTVSPYGAGQVVAKSAETAPNEWESIELTFTPCEGYVYYLKYFQGEVEVKHAFLLNHVYDNTDGSFSKTFQVLHRRNLVSCLTMHNALPPVFSGRFVYEYPPRFLSWKIEYLDFPFNFLRAVQQELVNSDKVERPNLDPILKDTFKSDLPINEGTLQTAEVILLSFIDEVEYGWDNFEILWCIHFNIFPRIVDEEEDDDDWDDLPPPILRL
jgi:hypothetical protein